MSSSSDPFIVNEQGSTAPEAPSATSSSGSTNDAAVPEKPRRKIIEYYAEESFKGADLSRHVHLGWGVAAGTALIMFCMGMSAATQARSWNVSFLWLQRRVGAQFATLSYMITDNLLHYHDGDKWITRDWSDVFSRWSKKDNKRHGGPSFASSALHP